MNFSTRIGECFGVGTVQSDFDGRVSGRSLAESAGNDLGFGDALWERVRGSSQVICGRSWSDSLINTILARCGARGVSNQVVVETRAAEAGEK